jgi:DUF971 family protein
MTTLLPKDITLDQKADLLIIQWNDGRVCRYPLGPLRLACPCAECRGGHANMGRQSDPENLLHLIPTRHYVVENLEIVGNYALQFYWNDGHHAGIYTWEYLYRLCPPEED